MRLHSVFSMKKFAGFERVCENINMCKMHKNDSKFNR